MNKTFLLASLSLPSGRRIAEMVTKRGWRVVVLDEEQAPVVQGARTFYGGTDLAEDYAQRFDLCLIEPPLGLLARVPAGLLGRAVRFGSLESFGQISGPLFVKPADPILKCFDAGVYRSMNDVQGRRPIDPRTPVLVSQPVQWTSEFRCFLCKGKVEAWSPYLSFGRPVWKPESAGELPPNLAVFCQRLVGQMGRELPPALVVDAGVMEDGRWAVVEFNPAWCSGLLGADVSAALRVVERGAMWKENASTKDRRWARLGKPAHGGAC